MGIQVQRPTLRKKMPMNLLETTPTKAGAKQRIMDHDSWHWGAFENLSIQPDQVMSHPTRFDCADGATLAESPDASSKHLISPSTSSSSFRSPSSFASETSPTYRTGFTDTISGSVNNHDRLKKQSDEKGLCPMSFQSECRLSRWDSGRWHGSSFKDCSPVRPRGQMVCKCAAGLTADVAVVCCCFPLSLLHVLAIAFIKLPAAVLSRTVTRVKHKVAQKMKRAAVHEEDEDISPAVSCPPSRCRSYEDGAFHTWAPALAFGDQKLWKDYFDSPDVAVVGSDKEVRKGKGELLRGKSFEDKLLWEDYFHSPDIAGVWSDGELRKGNGEFLRGKS